jgi:DNA-binding NarL/FixJ family response regulator
LRDFPDFFAKYEAHPHGGRRTEAGSLSTMVLRVLVAEDNLLVREGIVRLLDACADVTVVGVCSTYDELLASADTSEPDVVLTDIRMPPTGTDEGIRAASVLRESHPNMGVVVLSQYAEPAYAIALFEQGSNGRGYLLKERVSDADQIVHAIEEVARGGSVIDPVVVETLVQSRLKSAQSPIDRLTPREREVLEQMAQGRNNAGIASSLFLSERAVEKHINSLFSKLGLSEEPDTHRRVKAVLLWLAGDGS